MRTVADPIHMQKLTTRQRVRGFRKALVSGSVKAAVSASLLTTALPFVGTASADTNPATEPVTSVCSVVRQVSTTDTAGVPAVAIGENLLFVNDVTFAAGDVYQDILQRPDGTLYYASHIDLAAFDSQLTKNLSNIVFTVNGVAIPFTTGSTPSPTGFVLATDTSVAGKTTLVMYFPGDAAAMIANPSGAGALSYTVPAGGQTFRLGGAVQVLLPISEAGKIRFVDLYALEPS